MNSVEIDFSKTNGQVVEKMDVQKLQTTLLNLLKLGKIAANLTPTDFDNKVIAFLEPVINSKDFVEVMAWAMDLFKKDPAQAATVFKSMIVNSGE